MLYYICMLGYSNYFRENILNCDFGKVKKF